MRILLVDDDEVLMDTLANHLIHQRYAVDIATGGESAQGYLDMFSYDLVVLDLNLPDGSGIEFCKAFRGNGYEQPILMLSATNTPAHKVKALDAGADDYVVKPFDLDELGARIRALLRREQVGLPTVLQLGGINLDPSTCETNYNGEPVHLTPKEFALLELFLRRPNRVYSLDAIIDDLWAFENPPSEDAVRTHIKGLRQKLSMVGAPKNLIKTVYGLGYRLNVSEVPEPVTPRSTTTVAVEQAWKKYQGVMQERVEVLERAAIAIEQGTLGRELYQTSQMTAHKLVGALGSFGFPMGSTLAQRLEKLLQITPSTDIPAAQFHQLVQQLRHEINETSVEDATETVTAGAPLLLVISPDGKLVEQLSLAATQQSLQVRQANTLIHAQRLLQQIKPQIVICDLLASTQTNESSDQLPDQLLKDISSFTKQFRGPFLLLLPTLPTAVRLQLVQKGASQLLDRTSPPHQLITEALEVMRSTTTAAKIVIVDDDPQILKLLQVSLTPWNFDVTPLTNGKQLWDTLATVNPDALVLDVTMPEMSGFEICQLLRADPRWRNLPIVFLTVHEAETTRGRAFRFGADDFINKSVATSELAVRILNQINRP
ncbi:multi-component transcriptional winged helix family [Leptolyngbya sp. Heron Island J]|uniref:response regulator n=1 Tax=Leptolyngbya sp. Heron Island J TaxID=1385935 RepID=UPI0003B954BD|nr:response regulator [Leptolyngbya sp. Heron Island J]ESA36493.1 multi-component transcriptional winged helix family [Leptolyngbya sp. Heron Island J]